MTVSVYKEQEACQFVTVRHEGKSYEVPVMPELTPGSTVTLHLTQQTVTFHPSPRGDRNMDWQFWCLAHRCFGKCAPALSSASPSTDGEVVPIADSEAARYRAIMAMRLPPEEEERRIRAIDAERLSKHNETFAAVRGEVTQASRDASAAFVRQGERLKAELVKEEATRSMVDAEFAALIGCHLYPDAKEHAEVIALEAIASCGLRAVKLAVIELLNEDVHPSKRCAFLKSTANKYFQTVGDGK